jgi:hypothetical protein
MYGLDYGVREGYVLSWQLIPNHKSNLRTLMGKFVEICSPLYAANVALTIAFWWAWDLEELRKFLERKYNSRTSNAIGSPSVFLDLYIV